MTRSLVALLSLAACTVARTETGAGPDTTALGRLRRNSHRVASSPGAGHDHAAVGGGPSFLSAPTSPLP